MISNESLLWIFQILLDLNNSEELFFGDEQYLEPEKELYDEIKSQIPLSELEKYYSKKYLNYLDNERYKDINKKEDKWKQ